MSHILQRFSPREWTLVGLTLLVGIVVPLYLLVFLPQWQRLGQVQTEATYLQAELGELQNNLRVREQVDHLYEQSRIEPLPKDKSDHIITSDLLREIDMIRSSYPSLTVGNIRPLPPEVSESSRTSRRPVAKETPREVGGHPESEAAKAYPVRLTVSGKLPEIVDFVTSLTHRRVAIRLDSFTLRGVQGVNQVECKLEVRMIGFPASTYESTRTQAVVLER